MPVVLQFAQFDSAAICGASASSSITDIGLGVWAAGIGGGSASATIEDVALLVYGVSECGAVAASEFGEDIVFSLSEFYGAASVGALCKGRMFIDPSAPVFNRYLPEGQSS